MRRVTGAGSLRHTKGWPALISFRSPGVLTLLKQQKSAPLKLCFIYCPSRRASKAVMPNKIRLRSKHRSTQPVWRTWYVGINLDQRFRCIEHLLSDLALCSALKQNSSLANQNRRKKKRRILMNTTGTISCQFSLSSFFNNSGLGDKMWECICLSHVFVKRALPIWLSVTECRWKHKTGARWIKTKTLIYPRGAQKCLT